MSQQNNEEIVEEVLADAEKSVNETANETAEESENETAEESENESVDESENESVEESVEEQGVENEDSSCKSDGSTCKSRRESRRECRKEKKDKVAALEEQVNELSEKLKKEKDDYLRLMAEFDNFRRRTAQEKLDLIGSASGDTIKGLLPILDDFERALKSIGDTEDEVALQAKTGTELIFNKLMSYLKSKGLSVIEAAGATFDTDLHEAVAQFPVAEEDKKGKVFDVVQTGYLLNGKVLRFAKVVVGI